MYPDPTPSTCLPLTPPPGIPSCHIQLCFINQHISLNIWLFLYLSGQVLLPPFCLQEHREYFEA